MSTQSLIIMATLSVAIGNLIDHVLHKHHDLRIKTFLEHLYNQLKDKTFPNIFVFMSEKTLSFFRHLIGPDKISIKKISLICLLSFYITLVFISTFHSSCYQHPMQYRIISIIIVLLCLYILYFLVKKGYQDINSKQLLFLFVLLNVLSIATQPIAQSSYTYDAGCSTIKLGFLDYVVGYYFACWTYGIVNLIFDFLTIFITIHILTLITEKNSLFEIFLYIIVDFILAFVLAGLSGYFQIISFDLCNNIFEMGQVSYEVFMKEVNLFQIYNSMYKSYINFEISTVREKNIIFFASSAFIPTIIYLFILIISYHIKLSIKAVYWTSVYILKGRIENEKTNVFTIIGAFYSVIFLLLALYLSL